VFDMMSRKGICFSEEKIDEAGNVRCRVRSRDMKKILNVVGDDTVVGVSFSEVFGLPRCVSFICFRPAILLGGFVLVAWMVYSSRIIWDVRVTGNDKTPTEEIVSLLDELGCGVGDHYPSIDFNHLHAQYSAVQHDIAWLSVYMNGTVAEVQVRELYADERESHAVGTYANLVAVCDGVVEEVNVFEGQACVEAGEIVRKGQVLISGVVEQKDGSVRYEYAAGEVFCTVAEPISVEISLERSEKQYTGREITQNRIKFFKKNINLFIKGGIGYDTYDKIYKMEQLYPLGLCAVPVWFEQTVYREYAFVNRTVSAEQAAEEAISELNESIRLATADADIVSREVRTEVDEGKCRLECLLYLSRNNVRALEFTAD